MDERLPKSQWPPGPWQDEPDTLDWRDERTGLACAVRRNMVTGTLCGYAGVPPGHAFFGWQLGDDIQIQPEDLEGSVDDVGIIPMLCYAFGGGSGRGTIPLGMALKAHGGVSWSGESIDAAMPSGLWWFGFDCGHAGDLAPGLIAILHLIMPPEHMRERARLFGRSESYRDIEYVRKEVTHLAWQLRQLETRVIAPETAIIGEKKK